MIDINFHKWRNYLETKLTEEAHIENGKTEKQKSPVEHP